MEFGKDQAWNTGELAYFDIDWSNPRGILKTTAPASQVRKSFEFLSRVERAYYDTMRAAYRHAIEQRYRFFSYGDASLLLTDRAC